MNYFRRTLPSLDALVFFEAAARLQNFTHAAADLHVSQVAVSKRIRALEADLGVVLFTRLGRSLILTPEGRAFAERTHAGLAFLEDAISAARRAQKPRQIIQVAANENVNFFWLAPLVRDFQMAGSEAVVSVVTANNVTDVLRADTDLAIFYGKTPPEGWDSEVLFDEIIAPVARPGSPTILLDYGKEAPEWVNWQSLPQARRWFPDAPHRECSSYIQSVGLAVEGKGVALGVLPMLAREIAASGLAQLSVTPILTGHRYFLGTPLGRPVSQATKALVDACLAVARAKSSGTIGA